MGIVVCQCGAKTHMNEAKEKYLYSRYSRVVDPVGVSWTCKSCKQEHLDVWESLNVDNSPGHIATWFFEKEER